MNDQSTPATKADIQEILNKFGGVNERIDKLDRDFTKKLDDSREETNQKLDDFREETNQKLDDFREETNQKLDDFREETNRKLGDINSQLQLLVEKTHFDLAEASHDAEEVLKDHDRNLERRVRRLEKFAGFTAT